MIPWPVSQHALHDCRLRLSDRVIDGALAVRFTTFLSQILGDMKRLLL